MGFRDFFKKLMQSKEIKKNEKEKVSLSSLGTWVESKVKDLRAKEKEIISFIQKKIEFLSDELKEKIRAVNSFDVDSKKEKDRIKSAVEEGREKYLESVEHLVESLNSLKKERLEETIADTDRIFSDFNKRSERSYERATILIGKEMGEIKESLKAFSRNLIKVFDENKNFVESSRTISLIKLKLSQFEKIEQEVQKIEKEIISISNKMAEKEKENREILFEIDIVKKSSEYLKKQEKQEKIKLFRKELEKDISDLRQLIDFKALANFYHIFEDKIQVVKAHRDDFQTNFQKDDGKDILKLLETAKLNNKNISDKLSQIYKKKEEILGIETELENEKNKDRMDELHSANTKAVLEIDDLKNKKSKEEKRLEKLKEDKEKIISELKEGLKKFGVGLDF